MKNIAYLSCLQSINGLGPVRLKILLKYYKDPKLIWETPVNDLISFKIPQPVLENLVWAQKNLDPEAEFEKITAKNIQAVTLFDNEYPSSLKEIYHPPLLLYLKGEIPLLNQAIGVVGTRKITGYGKTVTRLLTQELAEAGLTIISGLARGVDTIAHQITVDAGGKTIAVLGGGLNNIFPAENTNLARTISEGFGCLISEYHPDAPSIPGNFPARNRIIAGLSQSVLVTEAAEDSGSLITARFALEQGKQVYAVPGPINSSLSSGPLELIRDGAKLVTKSSDILEDFGNLVSNKPIRPVEKLTELEYKIITELAKEKRHLDELTRLLGQPAAKVASSLLKLEIEGFVSTEGNGIYTKNLY